MATHTGIGRVGVIPVMTGGTIIGYKSMCPFQYIIVVVNAECGRFPTRVSGMTYGTIVGESQISMIRVGGLGIIVHMACRTLGRRTNVPAGMTVGAWGSDVRTGQWKARQIMIEAFVCITCGMTHITGNTRVSIPPNFIMLFIHVLLVMIVTIDASEGFIIGRIGMAISTGDPCPRMFSGINRKVLPVVLPEFSRFPSGISCMAIDAGGRDGAGSVIWIDGGFVILQVAGGTFS
jgi:hypothetical protein